MSTKTAASIMREQIEAFNTRDDAAFGATVAENMLFRDYGSGATTTDRESFVANNMAWRKVWSDVRASIVHTVDAGAEAVVEVRFMGTHDGPLPTPKGPIPASGRSLVVDSVMVVHAEGGVITWIRYYFNMLPALQQIGALPA